MTAQILDRTLKGYRIGDPNGRYPIMDATGSTLYPGRWNTRSTPMLYCCEHYSTAMLEKLVHGAGHLPPNQHFVEIECDAGSSYEVFLPERHPGWDAASPGAARTYGARWSAERRSLILLAPSVVARMERLVMINPAHPEFAARVRWSLHQPVYWDDRLFPKTATP